MVFVLRMELKGLSTAERTGIRHKIFGRVMLRYKKRYYYPGLLDPVRFKRVGSNVYVLDRPFTIPAFLGDKIFLDLVPKAFSFVNCQSGKEVFEDMIRFRGWRVVGLNALKKQGRII